tara:strand:+ start:496 stop:657 length:162 start_codon:yes stop_codon:yes gene_type:complete
MSDIINLNHSKCQCGGMVYTSDSKSLVARHVGSSPTTGIPAIINQIRDGYEKV